MEKDRRIMDCRKCQELLNAYLDGELEGAAFAEMERHIERCPDCKAELDRVMKMRALLSELRDVEVPEGEREKFIGALRDRLESERKRGFRREITLRPALIGAIAVVVILIAVVSVPREGAKPKIAPAPGLNALENILVDVAIVGALDDYFIATTGDFMSSPEVSGGQALAAWKVVKETHGDLFEPAPPE